MRTKIKILLSAIAALVLFFIYSTSAAWADVNDFTVTDFHADYTLTNDDPQGKLTVKETIRINFTDNNHGILRALPLTYNKAKLHTKILTVTRMDASKWPYTTYEENNNLVVKIGDPDRTVTGEQTFILDYQMENVITFYPDHDELYWDINGDQWQQPFDRAYALFHSGPGLRVKQTACYTGGYNATERNCQIKEEFNIEGQRCFEPIGLPPGSVITSECRLLNQGENFIQFVTLTPLQPYQTLTGVIGFEKGYFTPPTGKDKLKDNLPLILGILVPPLIFGGWAYGRWRKFGKDPKGRGVIIPEYGPPKGLSPAEVGAIIDYNVDNRDISATIIDLAIRKYLKIIVEEKKKLLKDKKQYSFELLNPDFFGLKPHEQAILEGIFDQKTAGEVVELKALKDKFYETAQSVQHSLSENLTTGGFFSKNPRKAGASMLAVAAVLFFAAFVLRNIVSLGLIAGALIVGLFALLMKQRTAAGAAVKDQIEGLKLYLKTAEKDRLKMLQSPDSPYMPKGPAPKRTVELFEKLLSYAVVLGVEKDWAKQFEGIYTTPPDWYSGNWATFNAVYFASSLSDGVSAMGTNFSPPSSSGDSGFGGGGFSGGGGGGGGGGGW